MRPARRKHFYFLLLFHALRPQEVNLPAGAHNCLGLSRPWWAWYARLAPGGPQPSRAISRGPSTGKLTKHVFTRQPPDIALRRLWEVSTHLLTGKRRGLAPSLGRAGGGWKLRHIQSPEGITGLRFHGQLLSTQNLAQQY